MTAGLPGTGIGGIFYLLIAFLMPIHELVCLLRGRSSWSRWRLILLQLSNASGVLLSLAGAAWLIRRLADSWDLTSAALARIQSVTALSFAWVTMAALGAVVLMVLTLRTFLALADRLRAVREYP